MSALLEGLPKGRPFSCEVRIYNGNGEIILLHSYSALPGMAAHWVAKPEEELIIENLNGSFGRVTGYILQFMGSL